MSKRCCAKMCFNSQTINKNISYFGFPKYEDFAIKWALAASRADLLEKKLSSITKYFLCSEHFDDDCFVDPPKNTRLKKTYHPLDIPVPTIFKCNINKFLPNAKKFKGDSEYAEEVEAAEAMPLLNSTVGSTVNMKIDEISIENLSVFHDHYNYPDISSFTTSILNNMSDHDLSNVDSFDPLGNCKLVTDEYDINSTNDRNDNEQYHMTYVCRLCTTIFPSTDGLIELSSDPELYQKLDQILPDMIRCDDNLSQLACTSCVEKLNTCIDTLNLFKQSQQELRNNF